MNMDELNRQIKACRKCRLAETRLNVLCGEGSLQGRIMLIAQAPGETEDREGRMFIGPSGRVLDDLLSAARVPRSRLYITNLVKCMLPKYRKPKQDEIEACFEWLDREIQLVNPDVLVPLGYYSAKYIFARYGLHVPSKKEFCSLVGRLVLVEEIKILPLSHPAVLLHQPHFQERVTVNATFTLSFAIAAPIGMQWNFIFRTVPFVRITLYLGSQRCVQRRRVSSSL